MPSTSVVEQIAELIAKSPGVDPWELGARDGEPGVDRAAVRRALREAAPLRPAAADPLTACRLIEAGYGSLRTIARRATPAFVADLEGKVDPDRARAVQARARGAQAALVQRWLRLRDAASLQRRAYLGPRAANLAVAEPGADGVQYSAVFGESTVRETPDDMSIFGPGAYLYDLMDLVADDIDGASPSIPAGLSLRERRPDLWNLPLTEVTTSDGVPQADLVREVLESTLRRLAPRMTVLPAASSGTHAGRTWWCGDLGSLTSAVAGAQDGDLLIVTASLAIATQVTIEKSLTFRAAASGAGSAQRVTLGCAVAGGALRVNATAVRFEGLAFQATTGPAVVVAQGAVTFVQSLFTRGPAGGGSGAWAIQCASGEVTLQGCTLYDTASTATPMLSAAGSSSVFTLVSSILWATGGSGGVLDTSGSGAFNVASSDVVGGDPRSPRVAYDQSNFTADPRFAGDPIDPLQLQGDSPCIGRGAGGSNVGASVQDLYAILAQAIYPFDVPFDAQVQAAVLALDELEVTLPEVREAFAPFMSGAGSSLGASSLGLAAADVTVLTTSLTDASSLAPYYGLQSFDDANVVNLPTDAGYTFLAADFARWTGLTPTGLRELVYQDLSPAEVAAGVQRGGVAWSIPGRPWSGFYVDAIGGAQPPSLALSTVFAPVGRQYLYSTRPSTGDGPPLDPSAVLPATGLGGGSFTVQLWLALGNVLTPFLSLEPDGSTGSQQSTGLSWGRANGALQLQVSAPPQRSWIPVPDFEPPIDLPTRRWTCLTTVYDAETTTLTVFVDGRRAGSTHLTAPLVVASSQLRIAPALAGAWKQDAWLATADVALWTVARAPTDIAADFQRRATGGDGLAHSWPLDGTLEDLVPTGSAGAPGDGSRWKTATLPGRDAASGVDFPEVEVLAAERGGSRVGLATGHLDRIHRFVRLARRLEWSFAELDWALSTLAPPTPDGAAPIDPLSSPGLFDDLARLVQLGDETGLSVLELCALVGRLKPFGRGRDDDQAPPFDRVYNAPPLAGIPFTPAMSQVVSVVVDEGSAAIVRRVAASLRLTTAELGQVVWALLPPPTTTPATTTITLDWTTLTYLFRFRLLLQVLGVGVDGLIELIRFSGLNPCDASFDAARLVALTRLQRDAREAGLEPASLLALTSDPAAASTDPYQLALDQRFRDGLPALAAAFRRGVAAVRVTPLGLVRQGLTPQAASDRLQALVAAGDVTASGLVRAQLIAWLPEVVVQVPLEQPTLSAGVEAAVTSLRAGARSAMVLIGRGEHTGPVVVDLSQVSGTLTLRSAAGAAVTVLDGAERSGPLLHVTGGEAGAAVVVDQLTISNPQGAPPTAGAALAFTSVPSVTVRGCRFLQDGAVQGPGVSFTTCAAALVDGCGFDQVAPAVSIEASTARVVGSTLYSDDAEASQLLVSGAVTLSIEGSVVWPLDASVTATNVGSYVGGTRPTLADPAHGDFTPVSGSTNGVVGYDPSALPDAELLAPFAFAQLEVLRAALASFLRAGELPLVPVLRYVGRVRNGIELLGGETLDADQAVDYLRFVSLYLLLSAEFELGGFETALLLPEPSLLATAAGAAAPAGPLWIPTKTDVETLARYLQLKEDYPDRVRDLWLLVRRGPFTAATGGGAVSSLFGWDPRQVELLLGALPTGTPPLAAILDLDRALSLSADTGLGLPLLRALCAQGFTFGGDGATPLLQAVAAADAAAAERVRSELSATKRRVLTTFARPAIQGVTGSAFRVQDDDDLSDYLLIDVRTAATTDSSRVLQATLSLQQYVQRVRLGLEAHAQAPGLSEARWQWMSSYGAWEANRRVFLYPENYVRPELRKDRTPLFTAFMSAVAGSAITKEQVEALYKGYLDDLATVASLRVVGAWYEPASPGVTSELGTYHLLGRTPTSPYAYHHRTYRIGVQSGARRDGVWTPWERVGVDVSSDLATPVIFRGQLHVFWSEASFVPDADEPISGGHFEVVLRFTVRGAGGAWAAPASPFPKLLLPPGVHPQDGPAWRRPYVVGTTYEGAAALLVQYGDFSGESDPRLFVLRQDRTVVAGLRFDASMFAGAALKFTTLVAAGGPGAVRLVSKAPFAVANASPLAAFVSGVASGASSTKTLTFSPAGPSTTALEALTLTGASVPASSISALAFHRGRYYFACAGASSLALYVSDSPAGSWRALTTPATGNARLPQLTSAHGWLYAAYVVSTGSSSTQINRVQLIRTRDGAAWETVASLLGATPFSALSLTTIGDVVYGVYHHVTSGNASTLGYFRATGSEWTRGELGLAIPPKGSSSSSGPDHDPKHYARASELVRWRGVWYLVLGMEGGSGGTADVWSASNLSGPWTRAGTALSTTKDHPTVGLVPAHDGLYLMTGTVSGTSPNQSGSAVGLVACRSASPTDLPWTTSLPASVQGNTSHLTRAPWPPSVPGATATVVLDTSSTSTTGIVTPGDDPSVVPVGNQLGAFVVGTVGGDFLAEALDVAPTPVSATVDATKGTCTFGLPVDAPVVTPATLQFRRLSSTAASALRQTLSTGGIDALMAPSAQATAEYAFASLGPGAAASAPPDASISFRLEDAYGLYYRELFCFIPWMLAEKLREASRFKDARTWLEYVFSPTSSTPWRSAWLASITPTPDSSAAASPGAAELAVYHEDPFSASALADLRPSAYQKAIFMAYVRNLVAWGDERFGLSTRETVNEAGQLYRLAADLLGPRPRRAPYAPPHPETYASLSAQQAALGGNELLIEVEPQDPVPVTTSSPSDSVLVQGVYFGVPDNPAFEAQWDELAERLFRIRHGLDASGAPSGAPLFEPRLDPTGLVRATAAGGQTSPVTPMDELQAQGSQDEGHATLALEAARGLAATVVDLGRSLLSSLEAKDAEALAALQARQQSALSDQTLRIRAAEVNEARATLASLQSAQASATTRKLRFAALAAVGPSRLEASALGLSRQSLLGRRAAAAMNLLSVPLHLLPNVFGLANGGMDWGQSAAAAAATADSIATALGEEASLLLTQADHERRTEDWQFESRLAEYDVTQLGLEVQAAAQRVQAAELQYALEATSARQGADVAQYYQSKFTNAELYAWLVDTLGDLYFQLYQVADGAARTAQGLVNDLTGQGATYVTPGAWNPRRHGLLAGERLQLDLARMELDLLEHQRNPGAQRAAMTMRLGAADPDAMTDFQTSGACTFDVPEAEVDRTQPGQYLRRLRDVTVELRGLEGEVVHGALTQLSGSLVRRPDPRTVRFLLGQERAPGAGLGRRLGELRAAFSAELGRTAPLEALAGAPLVGRYRLELSPGSMRADLRALEDVVLTFRYDARDGGPELRAAVAAALPPFRDRRWIDIARRSPDGWAKLVAGEGPCPLSIDRQGFARTLPGFVSRVARLALHLTFGPRDGDGAEPVRVACEPWLSEQPLTVPAEGGTVGVELPTSGGLDELCRTKAALRVVAGASRLRAAHLVVEAVESKEG